MPRYTCPGHVPVDVDSPYEAACVFAGWFARDQLGTSGRAVRVRSEGQDGPRHLYEAEIARATREGTEGFSVWFTVTEG